MNNEYGNTNNLSADSSTLGSTGFQMKQPTENDIQPAASEETRQNPKGVGERSANTAEVKIAEEEKQGEWKMPEPVFRVSSGKTPEKPLSAPQNNLPFAKPIIVENTSASAPVRSQPNISLEFNVGETIEQPPVKTESESSSIVFVVLGFAAMIVFAVAFLVAVYFLFFHKSGA